MKTDGLILWILAGTGVLFLYSAVKNVTPQSVIFGHVNGKASVGTDNAIARTAPDTGTQNARTIPTVPNRPNANGGLVDV